MMFCFKNIQIQCFVILTPINCNKVTNKVSNRIFSKAFCYRKLLLDRDKAPTSSWKVIVCYQPAAFSHRV